MMPWRQTGLSLVELMLASFISLILLAGVGQIFLTTKQMNASDSEQADMQDTARYLFHYLTEQVQQAGMVGCAKLDGNHYTSSITSYDSYYHDFHIGIQGYLKGSSTDLPSALQTLPILTGSDVVVVRKASEQGFRLVRQKSDSSFFVEHTGTVNGGCHSGASDRINDICSDDILIAVDCQKARSFVVSSLSTAQENGDTVVTIEHTTNNSPENWGGPSSATPLDKFDIRDTTLSKAATTAYYVSSDGNFYAKVNNDASTLLASGIDYLRILYGLDTDNDGSVNKYLSAHQVSSNPAVTDNFNQVVSLQIAMLLRSQQPVLSVDEIVNPSETIDYDVLDSTVSKTMDGYVRKVYTTTIQLRNGGV